MNFITETIDILYKYTKLTVYKIASKSNSYNKLQAHKGG
jgi:hypothetical protein